MTPDEEREYLKHLRRRLQDVEQGIRCGPETFEAEMRLNLCPTACELVIGRQVERPGKHLGEVEVLLFQRPDNDPHYPGLWHSPGTIYAGGPVGETDEEALARLVEKELHPARLVRVQLVGTINSWIGRLPPTNRASMRGAVFLGEIEGEAPGGKWFKFWDLPKVPLVESHRWLIPLGLGPFWSCPKRF